MNSPLPALVSVALALTLAGCLPIGIKGRTSLQSADAGTSATSPGASAALLTRQSPVAEAEPGPDGRSRSIR